MKLGKIFGSISPAYGLLSGQGLLGSKALAPLFGGLGMALGGRGLGGKGEDEEEDDAPVMGMAMQGPGKPSGMFGAPRPGFGSALSAAANGIAQSQQSGQFGFAPDPYQMMLRRQRMGGFGGGY